MKNARKATAWGLAGAILFASPAVAKKRVPIYPIDEVHIVDAKTRVLVVPPKIELAAYDGVNRRLDDSIVDVADWLAGVARTSLRAKGLAIALISPDLEEATGRVHEIADQYVRSRRGPEAKTELIRGIGAGARHCAVFVQHLKIEMDKHGWWDSSTGRLGVGMSNSDLRAALLDCSSGDVLWRGELYYRDLPDVDSRKWAAAAAGMYSNLRIGR